MGLLAENKSRSRINKDPNNTKWTRDTTTFGQKILRSQGWQPGQFLGAQDAAQSGLYTAANASYIRVTLKDDMKGLGFNKAKEDQVTGLDVFSDLLSRLNGKSEDAIEGDKQARLEIKTHRYVEAKWGPMRFVRGGLLVGDEMKEVTARESTASSAASDAEVQDADDDKSRKSRKSKKRKAADVEDSEADSGQDTKKKEKRRKKEERRARKAAASGEVEIADEESSRSKKKKKDKKDKTKSAVGSEMEDVDGENVRIEAKKSKKDKKRRKKDGEAGADTPATASDTATKEVSAPTRTGGPAPGSRNFVRSRFIAQKRQAVLDTKALAQIFMVKT